MEKERTSIARLMPIVAMRLVMRLLSDSTLKLLQNMPKLVEMMAIVRMMERSLIVRDVSPEWGRPYPGSTGR